jgi:hypothetical protein
MAGPEIGFVAIADGRLDKVLAFTWSKIQEIVIHLRSIGQV